MNLRKSTIKSNDINIDFKKNNYNKINLDTFFEYYGLEYYLSITNYPTNMKWIVGILLVEEETDNTIDYYEFEYGSSPENACYNYICKYSTNEAKEFFKDKVT